MNFFHNNEFCSLVEWTYIPTGEEKEFCAWCGNYKADGHRQDCQYGITKTKIEKLLNDNADLSIHIRELETYLGPNCPKCGAAHPIPLSTKCQCAQCMKVFTVK